MSLVYNERIKYLATALNGVAVGSITAGVIAPIIAISIGCLVPVSAFKSLCS